MVTPTGTDMATEAADPITPPTPGPKDAGFLDMVRQSNDKLAGGQSADVTPTEPSTIEGSHTEAGFTPEDPPADPNVDEGEEGSQKTEEDNLSATTDLIEDPLEGQDLPQPKKKKTKTENIKSLREALKAEKAMKVESQTKAAALEEKFKNVAETEEVKGLLKAKDDRIQELEKYEDLLGLYKTEGFQEAYYDSIETFTTQAKQIATDYQIDVAVIDEALAITNRRELNEHLSNHFDAIGVGDVRKYILDAQTVAVDRSEAEQNPKQARKELVEIMTRTKAARVEKVREHLKVRMKTSWDSTLAVYTDPDSGIEILKDTVGDAEHNQNRTALLTRAKDEFGKAMGVLVAAGAGDIPEGAIRALAARFQLSEVSGHLARTNSELTEEVESLRSELKKQSKYSRPLARGQGKGNTSNGTGVVETKDIASHTMSKALSSLE